MTSNFKPGDLAMVVGCRADPSDIGKVVELVQEVAPGQKFAVEHFRGFVDADVVCWVCASDQITSFDGDKGFALYAKSHLMPLRGDFAPEQQKAKEVEPCL